MATLETRLKDLATRTATECKSLRTLLNGNAADNSALLTVAKGNLVSAINEIKGLLDDVAADVANGAVIDDSTTSATNKTYSIDKIRSELLASSQALETKILGGAGAAYDTLKELQDLFQGSAADLANVVTALNNRVRVDVADQGLTTQQKLNARTNIDVYSKADIGNPDADFVASFTAGLV